MAYIVTKPKKYCVGLVEGYKVFHIGTMIGNNFYGSFFAAKRALKSKRWIIVKESKNNERVGLEKWIKRHPLNDYYKQFQDCKTAHEDLETK